MNDTAADFADVQGLVRFGFKAMTEACYCLMRVKDAAAARAWLQHAPVTSAVACTPPPSTALAVAFSVDGLLALGLPSAIVAGFSAEFLAGMTGDPNRSRRLGDVGPNAPDGWSWGTGERLPHVVVMFFAQPGGLAVLRASLADASWHQGFTQLACLSTSDLGGLEQFGFTDGISQPQIDWQQQRTLAGDQLTYTNLAALGEFVLGYRNEYDAFTERPLLDADGAGAILPAALDAPGKRDLGRNGTYVVLRDLRQDVRGFWQTVGRLAHGVGMTPDELAAAFVGRNRNGEPLIAASGENDFTYRADPLGARCPLGAHIRRANPRNADYVDASQDPFAQLRELLGFRRGNFQDDLLSSTRFHRILRRGREYGPGLSPTEAMQPAPSDDPERGLRFLCVNANISRQFEFLQNAWLMNPKFDGLSGESDPLLGNREALPGCPADGAFSLPGDGRVRRNVAGLPPFITVHGGAYLFLPGLRALRYIASVT